MQSLLNDKLLNTDSKAISGSYKLYNAIVPELDNLLVDRIESDHSTINISIFIVFGILGLVAYLFIGFYFSALHNIWRHQKGLITLVNYVGYWRPLLRVQYHL